MRRLKRIFAPDVLITIFAVLFFVQMGVFFVLVRDEVKVLILHSYTPEYSWTRGIDQGIAGVFFDQRRINSSYHYMATKGADDNQKRRAQKRAHRRIHDFNPDIILAIDDNANALVAKDYVGHESINIIFAGVNGSVAPYGYEEAPNVTGIYERKPLAAIVELINIINRYDGKPTATVFVSDDSLSAKKDAAYMQAFDWRENISYRGQLSATFFAEWKDIILNLPDDVRYILVGGYRELKVASGSNQTVPPARVAQWTVQNSNKIVIGLNVFNSQDGVLLSVGASPFEQGEAAGNAVLNLVKTGKPAGSFARVYPRQYLVSMNAAATDSKMYGQIPALLEAFAKSTGNYTTAGNYTTKSTHE